MALDFEELENHYLLGDVLLLYPGSEPRRSKIPRLISGTAWIF